MTRTLLAAFAITLSSASHAHPGHGTAPAADATGKPHVHFGTPKAPAAALKALPAGDTSVTGKKSRNAVKRAPRQELSHTR